MSSSPHSPAVYCVYNLAVIAEPLSLEERCLLCLEALTSALVAFAVIPSLSPWSSRVS